MTALDPVQVEALTLSSRQRGFGYWLEMGLGKSLIALTDFQRHLDNRETTRLLIVAPNSFKIGWVRELEKHGFDYDFYIFKSGARDAEAWLFHREYTKPPCLIINYDAIRKLEHQLWLTAWMKVKPTFLVFDESIQIKSNKAQQTKAALRLAPYAKIVRVLSGKPQTKGPHDLWAQLRVCGLFNGVNFYAFRSRYCVMGGFEGREVIGTRNEDELRRLMNGNVFHATKAEWAPTLPPKTWSIREYSLTLEQKRQYKQMEQEFVLQLQDETITVSAAISKYRKLAQIHTGFIYNEGHEPIELVSPGENPRLNALKDLLEGEIAGKAVIPYWHKPSFDLLTGALAAWRPAWIRGGMEPDEIWEQISRFNGDPDCRVILVQIIAGKYGHNLLGGTESRDRCCTMVFWENSYSTDDRSQVEDRIHRRGQTSNSVSYVDLVGTPLDRDVIEALQRKEDLFRRVFSKLRREREAA